MGRLVRLDGRLRRRAERPMCDGWRVAYAVDAVVVVTAGTVQEAVRARAEMLALQFNALPDKHARSFLAHCIFT